MFLKTFFRKLFSPMMWGNCLAMVLVLGGLLAGLMWWLDDYTHHGEGISVPDFSGLNYRESVNRGDELGLIVMVGDSTYNKKMPAGCVVAQKPVAGASVKSGRVVYVTINSLTMPRVAIPDLVGNSSYRQAQARLQALEFKLTEPKLIDGDKDWVYGLQCDGRNLEAGDMVAKESTLTLVIGNGLTEEDMELEEITEEEDFNLDDFLKGMTDMVDPFQDVPED